MSSDDHTVSRVTRTKAEARNTYDRISRIYDFSAGLFERRFRNQALERLAITRGESVLEIGFGTGQCLSQIAESVGAEGRVCGIDISAGMLAVSEKRLAKAGLLERVELRCEDAMEMPYQDAEFDAVFLSFALELFDSPEIPKLLAEIRRVLRPHGRLGVVSLSREDGDSTLLKLYEWAHEKMPRYVDCRPIYVERSLAKAGFEIRSVEKVSLFGLPGEIVVGAKP